MKTSQHFTLALLALAAWIAAGSFAAAQATSRMSSIFLARGEQAMLEIAVSGEPDAAPLIPTIPNVAVQSTGAPGTSWLPGRRMEYVFQYIVASYETGRFTVPPVEVRINGEVHRTQPLDFKIFDPDELVWAETTLAGQTVRYASSFRVLDENPFEKETTPAEIKLYVPETLFIEDWGIPDFERDGLTAWRFQPGPIPSRINLLGTRYVSVAYPSTITPTRTGTVSIGPAKIRLMARVVENYARQMIVDAYVQVPKLELQAKPLPPGAPVGFENAVGDFTIAASTTTTELDEGDPIIVDLIVRGSGNLDTLRPPQLADKDGWKIYGTTTEQRGDERRQLTGSVVFHQSIRPLEMKAEIPPFRLVYFDPRTENYETLLTDPIPLTMSPGSFAGAVAGAGVPAASVPLERMSDILAVLRPAQLTIPASPALPAWIGHAIGGVIALFLIAKAFWMRLAPRLRKDPVRDARKRELSQIARAKSSADTDFLKSAGAFIERHLGGSRDPEIQAVLAERDAVCFRSEKPTVVLDRKRRSEILALLRRAALAFVAIASLGLAAPARAAEPADTAAQALEAYEAARFSEAIKLWLGAGDYERLSADTLYNIGNACYRSGSPGQAALYYRRALVRNSAHEEARQNLRFIERKHGSITVPRADYQYAIAAIPLSAWKATCWAGLWLAGLGLLVFPATRPGARARLAAVGALVAAPLLVSAGLLGWNYFPDDAEFAPLENQAVVIQEDVALHTDAARTAPEVIDAPPGSLCEIITRSGRWAYVGFATETRGWVPMELIEKVIPEKPPEVPEFRKPKADGKTA